MISQSPTCPSPPPHPSHSPHHPRYRVDWDTLEQVNSKFGTRRPLKAPAAESDLPRPTISTWDASEWTTAGEAVVDENHNMVGTRRSITPALFADGRLCREMTEYNLATCQLEKRLNKSQPVTVERVDVYEVPHLEERFQTKSAELAVRAGASYDPIVVFHGTRDASIPKIMSEGFEVGGAGKVPIRTGTLLGQGVYTSTRAEVPDGYFKGGGGGGVKKLIMAVAVEGKRGGPSPDAATRAASDSWRNSSDDTIVVFKSGAQLLPKWVVHYS